MAKQRKLEASPSADRAELRRLLDAAKADHHDDGPRLALADWLEENGGEADRARAEVIRLQLDTANGGPDWSLAVERLRERHVREWVAPHRAFFSRQLPRCRRGLLRVDQSAEKWAAAGHHDDGAWAWVETAGIPAPHADDVPALLASPRLASVPCLDFDINAPARASALAVAACHRARTLHICVHARNVAPFAAALRPGLRELSLSAWGHEERGWAALFRSEGAAGLTALRMPASMLMDAQAAALAAAPGMAGLRRLEVGGSLLANDGLVALSSLPLRSLSAERGSAGKQGLARLGASRCGAALEELRLCDCRPGGGWDGPLPRSFAMPRLRRLMLRGCDLGAASVRALARSLDLSRLDELDLSDNGLGPEGVDALGEAGPRSLILAGCGLGDEGAARLASWPGLARVRFLDLRGNGLTSKGAAALAASPHASALEALGLGGNPKVVARGVSALLASPLGPRLLWLSLEDIQSQPAVARAFIARRPAALRQLHLGWHAVWSLGGAEMIRLRAALPGCAIG